MDRSEVIKFFCNALENLKEGEQKYIRSTGGTLKELRNFLKSLDTFNNNYYFFFIYKSRVYLVIIDVYNSYLRLDLITDHPLFQERYFRYMNQPRNYIWLDMLSNND